MDDTCDDSSARSRVFPRPGSPVIRMTLPCRCLTELSMADLRRALSSVRPMRAGNVLQAKRPPCGNGLASTPVDSLRGKPPWRDSSRSTAVSSPELEVPSSRASRFPVSRSCLASDARPRLIRKPHSWALACSLSGSMSTSRRA